MDNFKQILDNLNSRYVLLKISDQPAYVIVDKLRKSIVNISDPLINFQGLVVAMLSKNVEVYDDFAELPDAIEKPEIIENVPVSVKVFIQKIYNEKGRETGAIITSMPPFPIHTDDKNKLEEAMKNFAFTSLYPNEGLNIYSNEYSDTASIAVIKDINNLPYSELSKEERMINLWK